MPTSFTPINDPSMANDNDAVERQSKCDRLISEAARYPTEPSEAGTVSFNHKRKYRGLPQRMVSDHRRSVLNDQVTSYFGVYKYIKQLNGPERINTDVSKIAMRKLDAFRYSLPSNEVRQPSVASSTSTLENLSGTGKKDRNVFDPPGCESKPTPTNSYHDDDDDLESMSDFEDGDCEESGLEAWTQRQTETQTRAIDCDTTVSNEAGDVGRDDADYFPIDDGVMEALERLAENLEDQAKETRRHADVHLLSSLDDENLSIETGIIETAIEERNASPDPTSGDALLCRDNGQRIVRNPFPRQVQDRSPILGLSTGVMLRTCFRVGEAINVGCEATRQNRHVVIDLYARLTSSWCEKRTAKRHFILSDIYHDNPPFLDGVYETMKESEELGWMLARFPSEKKKLCRVVGSMRRESGSKWEMLVQSVRETTWAEVNYVAGIYS